ncbi:MAG: ABC transporter permease [Eubacteriales bacterium]|nr:ABC transporter permease [Eubacteriales bacterium]
MSVASYFSSLSLLKLAKSVPGGVAQGLIWGLMALGVYITFRILDAADLTVDGSFTLGGAVAVMMILGGCPAWLAVLCAVLAGMLAGFVTGVLHVKLGIPIILAGILTQFSLYSINLHIMGMAANKALSVDKYELLLSSRAIPSAILTSFAIAFVLVSVFYWYFGTERGCAIRCTGNNPALARALGINIGLMKIIALSLSNGLVALSGALMSQFQGFADINMGRGAIVIGEAVGRGLLGKRLNFYGRMSFAVLGGVMYYLVVVVVLWLRLNSNDLKLITAIIVALFLAVPYLREKRKVSFRRGGKEGAASC